MKLPERQPKTEDRVRRGETPAAAPDHRAMLRASAADAEPSTGLRARVLASFDQRTEGRNSVWKWLAPAAAVAMVASVAIGLGYWRLRMPQLPTPPTIVANRIPDMRTATPVPQVQVEPTKKRRVSRRQNPHRAPERVNEAARFTTPDLPVGQFESLLYCDPFSCGDPMQVIRLEMPAANVGRAYRSLARNGFVNAELIVGNDGLTRAVRFTK